SFDIPETYVLPDVKNTVGYYLKNGMDLLDLFIGAEGTLGVVSRIKLKLIPTPESVISMVIFFDDIGKSFEFLTRIKELSKKSFAKRDGNKIEARLIEFYDQKALALLSPHLNDIPEDCKAAFWIEQECKSADECLNVLLSWENFLTASNIPLEKIWLGADEKDRAKIIDMRHLLPILVNDLVKINGMKKMGTDIALPDHEFEAYYYDAIKSVEEVGVDYVMFGHFGNSHIHLNMLPVNTDQMIICKNLYAYLCSEAIRLGGTFSAEHGVGKIKKDYLKMMYPQKSVAFMQRVKLDFDPKNIVGLGNIF
ncbi:MAG: FAD-binding oxidoreductase, partial [Bacteroidota bacterium]|nr:FAD-binding oxidoreductase [Bacteroidota bacterium]